MRFGFTIRDLLWLTVGIAGIAAIIGAALEDFNAGVGYKPHPIPDSLATRLLWQAIGGAAFIVLSVVSLVRRQ